MHVAPDACKCINTSIRGQISGTGKEIASPVCSPGNIKRGDSLVLQEINSPGILSTRRVLEAYCHSAAVPRGGFKIRGEDETLAVSISVSFPLFISHPATSHFMHLKPAHLNVVKGNRIGLFTTRVLSVNLRLWQPL